MIPSYNMAVPFKAPANFRNFVRILAIISVLRSIELPFLLERSSGKTILYELTNTRAPKRAFHRSTVRYTANGDSSFNPAFINLELLKAGDAELNPGDDGNDIPKLVLPNRGLRIGQWNVEQLTDSKFEQISFLLTTSKNVDVLFLLETFLKPSKPDSVYNISGYHLLRKDRVGQKGGGFLAYVANGVKANRIWDLEDNDVESL